VTLTLPVLNAARLALFVVTGASKAECVRRAFAPEPDVPAGLVLATHRTHWLLDAPAAVEMLAEQAKQNPLGIAPTLAVADEVEDLTVSSFGMRIGDAHPLYWPLMVRPASVRLQPDGKIGRAHV
jgi:hypothetical protein